MSIPARTTRILYKCSCYSGKRKFHTTPTSLAARAPRRSPRVGGGFIKPHDQRIRVQNPQGAVEDTLPPIALLKDAQSSGVLAIEPENILQFLRRFQILSRKQETEKQNLCTEFEISPIHLVVLANILRKIPNRSPQSLARELLVFASEKGEKSATFALTSSALKSGSFHEFGNTLYHLGTLAKAQDQTAMFFLAKVLIAQSKEKEALQWLQKATHPATGNLNFDGAGEALVMEGRILLKQGDRIKAEESFRKAAEEVDEPFAYFYLSQFQEAGSKTQKEQLLKSASSGVMEACHNLGAIELSRVEKTEGTLDHSMATEWFTVAAQSGFGLSMLNLAKIHKSKGEDEKALEWLETAEKAPGFSELARALRSTW